CLDGTRVKILADIMDWAKGSGDPKILWLNGKAGTGKSTIARTVARNLDGADVGGEKCIVASFFFKRSQENERNIACLVPTLAKQLAHKMPSLKISIATALRDDAELAGARMEYQFEKLLQLPFESIMQQSRRTERVILVIDSLDECGNVKGIEKIVPLLANLTKVSSVNLRVMITTRPDRTTRGLFNKMDPQLRMMMDLDGMQEESIENDLRVFFNVELAQIRDKSKSQGFDDLGDSWPGESNFEALVQRSKPVFIVASTICKFIDDTNPHRRLQEMLNQRPQKFSSHMEQTYLPILHYASLDTHGKKHPDRMQQFSNIVKPLILLEQPLSANSLAELLKCSLNDIREVLDPLRSVLHVPAENSDPIIPYHLSFREFLVDLDGEARAQFGIDEEETHRLLLDKCLDLLRGIFTDRGMSGGAIEGGMCGPMCPGTSPYRISRETIREHISEAVEYAARYWPSHLIQSNPGSKELENLDGFLMTHFLHWIETMSWMGEVHEVCGILNQVLTHAFSKHQTHDLKVFLDDAKQWIRAFANAINILPLQTYLYALIGSPSNSVLRARFKHVIERSTDICVTPNEGWNVLALSPPFIAGISSVAISEAGNTVAASLDNGYVCLWDTNEESFRISQNVGQHSPVIFSPDGGMLAFTSSDYSVRVWSTQSREKMSVLPGGSSHVQCLAFSPDGSRLASGDEDGTVRVWDTNTWSQTEMRRVLEGHTDSVTVMKLSPDGRKLATGSDDKSVRLWDTDQGVQVSVMVGHSSCVTALAFSPDGDRIASGSDDRTVRVWNAKTGNQQSIFTEHLAAPRTVTFSPDGSTVVSGDQNHAVRVWDARTGDLKSIILGLMFPPAVSFSPAGKVVVAGQWTRTAWRWRAK
ncbi:WD40 repeat-like protein, partial [Piedraia hortae CBS 480.64]